MLSQRLFAVFFVLGGISSVMAGTSSGELIPAPNRSAVQDRLKEWCQQRSIVDASKLTALDQLWSWPTSEGSASSGNVSGDILLEKVMQSFALLHPPTEEFLSQLELPNRSLAVPDPRSLLNTAELGSFYHANLRLHLSKYFVYCDMHEEALELLLGAKATESVDPAGFLFFKATCEKVLGKRDDSLSTLEQLLKRTEGVPTRYLNVAALMNHELESLEPKSLDDVSGKMSDVQRRLRLARGGDKTQKVEKEIVDLLDEIIKKKEEQAQQQQQQQSGQGSSKGNSNRSNSAAQDSRVKGTTAPGEVDKKKLKSGPTWGNLDDKERARVKNLISRDFPAHYRQAIEEYFRKLATRDSK